MQTFEEFKKWPIPGRPHNAPIYSEPMLIVGIEQRPNGVWVSFDPYLLLPYSMESLTRSKPA